MHKKIAILWVVLVAILSFTGCTEAKQRNKQGKDLGRL